MLSVTRHAGERIRIGKAIIIEIQRIGDTQVRLGIEAPPSERIIREEGIDPRNTRKARPA